VVKNRYIATNYNLMRRSREDTIHQHFARFLKYQFPKCLFNTDLAGVPMYGVMAKKASQYRSGNGFPDIMIFEPRLGYGGLFIELKKDNERLVLVKDGQVRNRGEWKNDHVATQAKRIQEFNDRDYLATFAIGYDHAQAIASIYLRALTDSMPRLENILIQTAKQALNWQEYEQ